MAGEGAVGVLALRSLDHLDAGEIARMLLDVGDRGAAHVRRDRMEALGALVVVLDVPLDGDVGHAEDVGEVPDEHGVIGEVAIGRDRERGAIRDERHPVAIEDATPGRRRRDRARLILPGQLLVMVRGDHLHAPELRGDGGEDAGRREGEAREPSLHRDALRVALALGCARARPALRVVGESAGRTPKDRERREDRHDKDDAGDDDYQLGVQTACTPFTSNL